MSRVPKLHPQQRKGNIFWAKLLFFLLKKSSTQVCDVTIRPPFWKAQGWSWAVLSVLNIVEQTRPQEDRCQLGSLYPK